MDIKSCVLHSYPDAVLSYTAEDGESTHRPIHFTATNDTPGKIDDIIKEVGEDSVFESVGRAVLTLARGGVVDNGDGTLLELLDLYYDLPKD
jgi:hypothetical protein